MHSTCSVKSVGVDTLTCTIGPESSQDHFRQVTADLLARSAASGNRTHYFKRHYFTGVQTREIGIAENRGSLLCELRGATAREWWPEILPLADKVSRIDVQVTVEEEPYNDARAILAWFRAARRAKREGRPPRYTLYADASKGSTLYIGRLGSRFLARLYEKGKEDPKGGWENCWRYEVQARRERAIEVAADLASASDPLALSEGLVWSHFTDRGVPPIYNPTTAHRLPPLRKEPSDVEKSLDWLGASVAPVLRRLYSAGAYEDALARLGVGKTFEPA